MLLVGLTGGIGSGKSTVAAMLAERSAVVIGADELAREAVAPGTPGLARVLERFGPDVAGPDGSLDRERMAALVFADPEARRRLEAIVHPEVARLLAERTAPYRDTDAVVVYDVPLLVENHLQDLFDAVVVVTASEEERIRRLRTDRRMPEEEARARIRAQATDEERSRAATFTVSNDGGLEELRTNVDELWERLRSAA